MTDYRTIKGAAVQSRTSTSGISGEIWYDSSNGAFKLNTVTTSGVWTSGNSLNTARQSCFTATVGTQTAGLAAGGYLSGPASRSNATEHYDGTNWTSVNNVNVTLSSRGSAGTQGAALLFGGNPTPATVTTTSEYDGTNWSTSPGSLNNARGYGPIAAGTQTAALAGGGYNPPVTFVTAVEYYDGSCWTVQPNTNPNNYAGQSGGTQGAAWFVGAGGVGNSGNTEAYNWNGTSWSASGNYNDTSRVNFAGGGPQTNAFIAGGDQDPGFTANGELYDGTSWTTTGDLNTARTYGASGGDGSSALAAGGGLPGSSSASEEFTGPGAPTVLTLTTS